MELPKSELPLPVRGLQLKVEGQVEKPPEKKAEEEKASLSPEEFIEQFGTLNEAAAELDRLRKRDQLYAGRERVIEERNAQSARLLSEVRAQVTELRKTQTASAEPMVDPDDPKVFVTGIVDETITPHIRRLEAQLESLAANLAPAVSDAQFSLAKSQVNNLASRLGTDAEDFDERKSEMLEVMEQHIGRKIESSELGKLKAEHWTEAYLRLREANPKPTPKVEKKEQPAPKKIVVMPAGSGARSGSGPGTSSSATSMGRSLQDAMDGKKTWGEHLAAKIKHPGMQPRTG